jgi:ATP-dependent DNA helicase DinG
MASGSGQEPSGWGLSPGRKPRRGAYSDTNFVAPGVKQLFGREPESGGMREQRSVGGELLKTGTIEMRMRPNARRSDALLADFFAQDGPLAREKARYTRRPEQIELARAVQKTLSEKGVLLCDAPTGTGKSIGYISPAILRAAGVGERVVISTATISLQSQLLTEDIPPVRAAVASMMGYPEEEGTSYAVMKGRANFLCSQRHQDTLRSGSILQGEVLANLDRWAASTSSGDREDLDFRLPVSTWLEAASDGEDCAPNACAFREGCFYYAHRDRAQEADILVVNHALLLANVASIGNIFDTEGRHLIIDEAHRLEEIMAEAFGARGCYELDQEWLGNGKSGRLRGSGPTEESLFQCGFDPSS